MTTRREFVREAGAAAAAAAVAACGGGGDGPTGGAGGNNPPPDPEVTLALPAVGATVNIPNRGLANLGVAVTRLTDTAVVAVSRQCTHQGCQVGLPGSSLGNLHCPCHGSVFTVSGTVVGGPAPRPLLTYPTRIEGGDVVVTIS